jgi:hypothetical protein
MMRVIIKEERRHVKEIDACKCGMANVECRARITHLYALKFLIEVKRLCGYDPPQVSPFIREIHAR